MKRKCVNKLEKPTFYKMFGKKLVIWMIAVIVLGFVGTNSVMQLHEGDMVRRWEDHSEGLCSRLEAIGADYYVEEWREESKHKENKETLALVIDELSEEQKVEQFKLWVEYEAYVYSGIDTAYMLLNTDTLDTVTQSSYNKIYLLARAKGAIEGVEGMEGDFTIYACEEEEVIQRLRKEYAKLDYKEVGLNVWIEDIYVKGFTFIPGKVKLIDLSTTEGINYDNVVKELDFTPDNTSGYTHIVTDEMVGNKELIGPFLYHNDMTDMEQFMEEAEKETIEAPGFKEELENADGCGVYYTANGNLKWINLTKLSVGEGEFAKEFWVVALGKNSFFKTYQTEILIIYGCLLLIACIVAVITGYIAYIKEKSFYETDQYRRNMTNAMAHDLKSPLMVISGFAENLLEQDLPDKPTYFTKSIMENVEYMNRIIEKVLELSKVENADYKLQKEKVDLRMLSEELMKSYTSHLGQRGLKVELSGEGEVCADKVCMTQVLDNLIGNAVKYSQEDSVIEIRLNDKVYEIANVSSAKFDVDVKELVNPFVKGDNNRSGKKGSGIGLTIAKNLVEQHGYRLELEQKEGMFVVRVIV